MVIGIDIGGTTTRLRAVSADGRTRERRTATQEWLRGRPLDDPSSIEALLGLIATLDGSDEDAVAIGAHGCDTPLQVASFQAALSARRAGPVLVTNDAALVGPAAGVARAVGIIAGTGSIVVGADAAGAVISAGGHGWMIADPGSAPGLVREAVRAVLDRDDRGARPDPLGIALLRHYQAGDASELAWTFMTHAGIHRWAEAAPLVFQAADHGSADAVRVIDDAAIELARQVSSVFARGAVADAVIAAGGVVTHQPRLATAIADALARSGIDQPFRVLDTEPVAGAVVLARTLTPGRETRVR